LADGTLAGEATMSAAVLGLQARVSRCTFFTGAAVSVLAGVLLAITSVSRTVGAILGMLSLALIGIGLAYERATTRQRSTMLVACLSVLVVLAALGLITLIYAHFLTSDTSQ
jgi:drug/metabolite transporter (DMT)-like permease